MIKTDERESTDGARRTPIVSTAVASTTHEEQSQGGGDRVDIKQKDSCGKSNKSGTTTVTPALSLLTTAASSTEPPVPAPGGGKGITATSIVGTRQRRLFGINASPCEEEKNVTPSASEESAKTQEKEQEPSTPASKKKKQRRKKKDDSSFANVPGTPATTTSLASVKSTPLSHQRQQKHPHVTNLSKKEKGRFKKLIRRCKAVTPEHQISGIANIKDWNDLQHLLEKQHQSNNVRTSSSEDGGDVNGNDNAKGDKKEPDSKNDAVIGLVFGPHILLRQDRNKNPVRPVSTQPVDAGDHRDILFRLIDKDTKANESAGGEEDEADDDDRMQADTPGISQKKRKRDAVRATSPSFQHNDRQEESKKWPHWVCIHNPASVEHAAVLEIHVQNTLEMNELVSDIQGMVESKVEVKKSETKDDDNDGCPMLTPPPPSHSRQGSEKKISQKRNDTPNRCVTVVPTRWFKTLHRPESITSSLMYSTISPYKNPPSGGSSSPAMKQESLSANRDDEESLRFNSMDELFKALSPLTLSPEELKDEGYPLIAEDEGEVAVVKKLKKDDDEKGSEATEGKEGDDTSNGCSINLDAARVNLISPDVDVKINMPRFVSTATFAAATESLNGASTGSDDAPKKNPRIFGLDCEMVQTQAGSELVRVTLVQLTDLNDDRNNKSRKNAGGGIDLETKVCIDQLVQPQHPVVDYLTEFSGVTAESLEKARSENKLLTLEQVQEKILKLVSHDDILIGHSLENDLLAVRCHHGRVVDTAVLFRPSNARFKYSLKQLATTLLRKNIRQPSPDKNSGNQSQHCSLEDAVTALEVAAKRAWIGPIFGAPLKHRKSNANQLIRLASTTKVNANGPIVTIGPSEWLQRHVLQHPSSIHALTCESSCDRNRQALIAWLSNQSSSQRRRARVVWTNFQLRKDSPNEKKHFMTLLGDLLTKTSPTTVLVVAIQVGYDKTAQLTEQRRARMKPRATIGWTDQEQAEWLQQVHASRTGTVMWIGTKN